MKAFLRSTLACCACLLGAATGTASQAADAKAEPRLIAAADLQADAALMLRTYEALHPGLYRYRSKAEIDAAFAVLQREFRRDRTLPEAYLAISRFTTVVQCGHTYANFYNQDDAVADAVLEAPRVPFQFRWLDRRMIVTRSFADAQELQRGAEVLSIDGRPVGEILVGLLPYSRADGDNTAKRIVNLEVQGLDRIEAFDVFFPLVFPREPDAAFALTVRTAPGGPVRSLRVAPMPADARPAAEGAPGGDANPWEFRELQPGVAYLRMPTWALYNSTFQWQAYLTKLFTELVERRTKDLVIDLRGNEGGLSVGDAILGHFVDRDLPSEPVLRKTRYRKVPVELAPHLQTWDRSFFDWGPAAVDLGDGFYRLTRYEGADGEHFPARPPRYTGRAWVLIGAANSSATFEFAQALQRHRLGTLVGQTTGGNQRGITGGAFFFLTLPKSGIEVDVPLIGQFPVSQMTLPDGGIDPDVRVRPTIEDIAAGRDPELDAVLRRIREDTHQSFENGKTSQGSPGFRGTRHHRSG